MHDLSFLEEDHCPFLKKIIVRIGDITPDDKICIPVINETLLLFRLVSLEFDQVSIGRYVGSLVSSCPLLEKVTLAGSTHFECIEIDASNLKYLNISARFGSVHLKNTPLLKELFIESDCSDHLQYLNEKEAPEMAQVFGCLPVIDTLQLGYRFVAFLTVDGVPERLPFTLDHLKNLELFELYFGEIAELAFALCLIKSSPNFEYFEIQLFSKENDATPPVLELLEMQDHSDVAFNQLREVVMQFVSGTRPELEFIKLILAKSPLLETRRIESNSTMVADNGVGILGEVTQFRRMSPEAQIFYKEEEQKRV
ncbi:F-box/FBD/LRR-repeat protein At1g13570-like [Cornus florida]|uniref:F-box/FBD/LRR-repeat protein At1g13570-like n=1 Tax=Cornus florida TaxID=4283 RepID=UPI00289729C0|nr:F-box/FBD/LRR-repeat protein At1g13570-like [Cornus florida]